MCVILSGDKGGKKRTPGVRQAKTAIESTQVTVVLNFFFFFFSRYIPLGMGDKGSEDSLGSRIASLVHAHFDALPPRSKPTIRPDGTREWIPMSGIVLVKGMFLIIKYVYRVGVFPLHRIASDTVGLGVRLEFALIVL